MTDSNTAVADAIKQAYQLGNLEATTQGVARDVAALRKQHELQRSEFVTHIDEKLVPLIEELDKRVTSLEKWRWQFAGGVAVVVFIISVVGPFLQRFVSIGV